MFAPNHKLRPAVTAVVVEPATGAIVHAFTSGTVVQIFQLEPGGLATHVSAGGSPDGDAPPPHRDRAARASIRVADPGGRHSRP